MIELNWSQVSDHRMEAEHGTFLFAIVKSPDWSRHPMMGYQYAADVHDRGNTRHDLGMFKDSTAARAKCAEFINSKAGDSQ